jgi:thiol-disulfide isomerase/thioredoxin
MILFCAAWIMSLLAHAQIANQHGGKYPKEMGLKWSSGITWEQVKAQARSENKYIFVDCYTTWCGPCKRMDEIYANDSVKGYLSNGFISVKLQMDRTVNDNETVMSWYNEADTFRREYRVTAFPTFIFFSPDGEIVHKDVGFKPVIDFITMAREATTPGKIFNDPYAEYDRLIVAYNSGSKDYSRMPYMIDKAEELGDTGVSKSVLRAYINHLANLKGEQVYTRDNIAFLASHINSKSKMFSLFYPDGSKVDYAMMKKGYAERFVEKVIQREIVYPFLGISPNVMRNAPTDNREADWKKLYNIIKVKFDSASAERGISDARLCWYFYYNNYPAFAKYYLLNLEKYGADTTDLDITLSINFYAYEVFFKSISDRSQLKSIIKWMPSLIRNFYDNYDYLDTYANLLYKVGNRVEALKWEHKALDEAIKFQNSADIDTFRTVIRQIRRGQPTWVAR